MDLSLLKQKLDTIQNRGQQREKKDYSLIFWRPTVGKHQIRIVPSAFDKSNPFKEVKFYYGITNKVMISPLNFGDKDPINEFVQKLYDTNDKSNYDLARKLKAKTRIFVPVIVRGEEDKGVRLWQFGQNIYTELLSMAADEEIGDFTDVANGLDFTLETVGPESTGTQYNKTTIRAKRQNTPLSEDASQVETWLEKQPNPLEEFKRFTFDEMKTALQKYLTPEEESEGDIIAEPAQAFDGDRKDLPWEENGSNFSLDTSKSKQNKVDQFDSLFNE